MDSSDDTSAVKLPVPLLCLEQSGARFKAAPKYGFMSKGNHTMLNKRLSIYFTVDTICTPQDILYGFDEAGIELDKVVSIQRKNSSRSWVVSFISPETKEKVLNTPCVTISGCQVFLGDSENRTVIVKIYECPDEMPDTFIIGRLSRYGTVLSFRQDLLATRIENGIHTSGMHLAEPIPSSIFCASEAVYIFYPSQLETCRRCGEAGHAANKCSSVRCLNCEKAGHRINDCLELELCKICHDEMHTMARCPFFIYSADVEPSAPGTISYAMAAKTTATKEQKNTKEPRIH